MERVSSINAEFATGSRFQSSSPEKVQHAKKDILDFMGVSLALAGSRAIACPKKMVVDYRVAIGGKAKATVVQSKKKIIAVQAAFANASCAHALDMDDGHRFGALHPSVAILSAALATAEL